MDLLKYLENQISEGKEIDLNEIQIKLNAMSDQLGIIKMLVDLAKLYYPERVNNGHFNPKFFRSKKF